MNEIRLNKSVFITYLLRHHLGFRNIQYLLSFFFLVILLSNNRCFAQEDEDYVEISVFMNVPKMGGGDIDAVIKGEVIYLPITFLFDFLKIKNTPSPGFELIEGFFINPSATYRIDKELNNIQYNGKSYALEQDGLILTETNLYLREDYYGEIFGLDCVFHFRSLSVTINSRLELPIIRKMRQDEMRKNLSRLKGKVKADTTIGRTYPFSRFGTADWSIYTHQQADGNSVERLNLTLGQIIAGGETTISLNYDSDIPFSEKRQHYLWRYVNNDSKFVRQILLGKISSQATSSIFDPIVGAQFTNTPTTFRRSFGTYTLSDKTEPGWVVELYVNNILIDYVNADASGFFTFEIPLVYGNSLIKLKFFGPWGEERSSEQNISIPYNFVPKNELEYTISAGIVEDTLGSKYSRANFNYGLTRNITVGAGYEYLSSVSSGTIMPFVNTSFSLSPNLLMLVEYTHLVRTKAALAYRLPSNLQIDLNYTKYADDQKAIKHNYLEERRAMISMPIRLKKFSAFTRLSLNQLIMPSIKNTTVEWLFSSSFWGVNANVTANALYVGNSSPYIYSNLSLSFRAPVGFTFYSLLQYGISDKTLVSTKLIMERRLFKHGFFNLSYEQNFRSNIRITEIGFRFDFNFAQTGSSARKTDKLSTFNQYARGSIIYDPKSAYVGYDNRSNIGRGGIVIIPYIDANFNGKKDSNEPKVYGLNLKANSGRVEKSKKDSSIRILGIEAYTECFIEFDQNSFDNISWRLKHKTMNVSVEPNTIKIIEIPIHIVGEAAGEVTLEKNGKIVGLGRMIVNFYSSDQKLIGRTISEQDGYFSYFGLTPGNYFTSIDTAQLRRLGMVSFPDSIPLKINESLEGDFVEMLNFRVKKYTRETAVKPVEKSKDESIIKPVEKPIIENAIIKLGKDSLNIFNDNVIQDTVISIKRNTVISISQDTMTLIKNEYIIQLGAFRYKSNADALKKRVIHFMPTNVVIIIEDGLYKVRIIGLESIDEVNDRVIVLNKNGFTDIWKINDNVTSLKDYYTIQLGAFRYKSNSDMLLERITHFMPENVVIIYEDGLHKVRIIGLESLDEINDCILILNKNGLTDIWKIPLNFKK